MKDKPTSTSDVLYGLEAIAGHLGMAARQAKHRVATAKVPIFRMGGRMICARKTTLNAWLAEQEAKARKVPA